MDTAVLKQKIIAKSKELALIRLVLLCRAFTHLEESMRRSKELGHTTGFEHPVLEERIYPREKSRYSKTIISIVHGISNTSKNKPERGRERRGAFARASWGGLSPLFFQDAWKH